MGPIFLILVAVAVLVALFSGQMEAVTRASVESAGAAVTLAIGLVGVMTFWLGLVEVLKQAGLLGSLSRGLKPLFRRIFPDIPDGHPALAAITMNVAANMMGLVNAATPFGIAAMRQLDRLNSRKGTATDAMCLFLALNTSALAILPTGVIAARAALGSADAGGIVMTTLFATSCSTLAAFCVSFLLARLSFFRRTRPESLLDAAFETETSGGADEGAAPAWRPWRVRSALATGLLALAGTVYGFLALIQDHAGADALRVAFASLPLPLIILFVLLYGWSRGVSVYGALVEGGKEGFQVAIRIIPYMVAVLVAVGMFRASGALEALIGVFAPFVEALGMPGDALPMALLRPLSGSGSYAVMAEIMQANGPDSFVGYLVSTMQGSTETTFYVLAVYGGEVGLRRTRWALPACLFADVCGIAAAVLVCHWLV